MDDRRKVLDLLRENARYSIDDIARQTGLDADDVSDIIGGLEGDGVVRGYLAVVDWDEVEDNHVEAEVELNVELDRETSYSEIAHRIAKFPEVSTLRLVSGEYDFVADLEGESMHDISDFVADQIAPIPEVTQTVTHFVMTTYKERGIMLDAEDDDERLSISP